MPMRTVLITGCSDGGLGAALAVEFARRGLHVFATARNTSKMAVLEKIENVTLLALDVTSQKSLAAAVEAVKLATGGTLDVLVNNSGAITHSTILDTDLQQAKDLFDVNYFGAMATVQAFAPLLLPVKGSIVIHSSSSAAVSVPFMGSWTYQDIAGKYIDTEQAPTRRRKRRWRVSVRRCGGNCGLSESTYCACTVGSSRVIFMTRVATPCQRTRCMLH